VAWEVKRRYDALIRPAEEGATTKREAVLGLGSSIFFGSLLALLWHLLAPSFVASNPGSANFFDKPIVQTSSRDETTLEAEKNYPIQEEVPMNLVANNNKQASKKEAARSVSTSPRYDLTMYLTIPRLGLYEHTVRNIGSQTALDVGAIKLPSTAFPWQRGDTNTFIICHRLGFPGTQSYNQCLNLPSMRRGDEIFLKDVNGNVYKYRVTQMFAATPYEAWVTKPVKGREIVSLETCIENLGDYYALGPHWQGRLVVRADRVAS
jgi:LPXTG-site transpeptidase (sortase) family protein